jgi:hypothetical protein
MSRQRTFPFSYGAHIEFYDYDECAVDDDLEPRDYRAVYELDEQYGVCIYIRFEVDESRDPKKQDWIACPPTHLGIDVRRYIENQIEKDWKLEQRRMAEEFRLSEAV